MEQQKVSCSQVVVASNHIIYPNGALMCGKKQKRTRATFHVLAIVLIILCARARLIYGRMQTINTSLHARIRQQYNNNNNNIEQLKAMRE